MLYVTLGVCALLAALLVYRYDLYEREPWYMLLLMGAAGAAAMWLANRTEWMILSWLGGPTLPAIAAVASTHEETLRLLLVGVLAATVPAQFNDPMDGLVYGSIVGLGMAVYESVDHMAYLPIKPSVLPATEVVRLAGHLVLGGITCFGVGLAALRIPRWPWALVGCVVFAMAWHFLWDWIALSAWINGGVMQWWQTLAGMALMLSGILFYGVLVTRGSRHSRLAFAPESTRRLWGWPFTR